MSGEKQIVLIPYNMDHRKTMREEDVDWSIPDDPPPIMGSWKRLYLLVLLIHTFIIFLFWLFTKTHS